MDHMLIEYEIRRFSVRFEFNVLSLFLLRDQQIYIFWTYCTVRSSSHICFCSVGTYLGIYIYTQTYT